MGVQESIREAIIVELRRQSENSGGALQVEVQDDRLTVNGPVNLEDLIMVIAGTLAGGP